MTPTTPYHPIFVQLLLSTGRLYNYGRLKTKENFQSGRGHFEKLARGFKYSLI